MARSAFCQFLVSLGPVVALAACGDDGVGPAGAGGFGGAGGATSSAAGPTTTGSTTVASSSVSTGEGASTTTSDGGGTTTSDGGGTTTSDGGGGTGGAPDGGGGSGGTGGVAEGGGGSGTGAAGGGGSGGAGGAASSSASTGGGTVVQPGGLATCPGDAYVLEPGASYQLQGTTTGASDDYASCFGATGGNDTIFSFTLTEPGTLKLRLQDSAGFNGNLVLRAVCDSATSEQCIPASAYGDTKGIARHFNAGTYYVVVDALPAGSGDFDLFVTFDEAACGDAIVNPGEECDVGPAVANDGCGNPGAGNECEITAALSTTDQCPGEALAVPAGSSTVLATAGYSTLGHTDDASGSCFFATGGVERIFALTPAVSGSLTVDVGRTADDSNWACQVDNTGPQCWDQFLYARTDCTSTDLADELDCADEFGTNRGERLIFDVIEGETVYLFVDGFNGAAFSQGPFNLHFQLDP